MPGLFVLAGNTFPRRMSKRPIQSPPDRHSGAAGLEWGLVQEPVCIIAPERKTDPGEAFDWSRYRAGLTYSKEET